MIMESVKRWNIDYSKKKRWGFLLRNAMMIVRTAAHVRVPCASTLLVLWPLRPVVVVQGYFRNVVVGSLKGKRKEMEAGVHEVRGGYESDLLFPVKVRTRKEEWWEWVFSSLAPFLLHSSSLLPLTTAHMLHSRFDWPLTSFWYFHSFIHFPEVTKP